MLFPGAEQFIAWGLLALRLIVAIIFGSSGWRHMTKTKERAESMGLSMGFTFTLGLVEFFGAIALVLGVFTQLAALGLMASMLGAIYKKIFVWKSGFWGEKSMGWHYDLLLLIANLVIFLSAGGGFVLI